MTGPRPLAGGEGVVLSDVLAAMDPWKRLGYGAVALAAYLERDDPGLTRMVAVRDGQLAGVIALRSPWLRGPCVELLAVLPAFQGVGIGRVLLDWAVERAPANLWACVSAFNHPARLFYRRNGFAEIATLAGLILPNEDEILLRRRPG